MSRIISTDTSASGDFTIVTTASSTSCNTFDFSGRLVNELHSFLTEKADMGIVGSLILHKEGWPIRRGNFLELAPRIAAFWTTKGGFLTFILPKLKEQQTEYGAAFLIDMSPINHHYSITRTQLDDCSDTLDLCVAIELHSTYSTNTHEPRIHYKGNTRKANRKKIPSWLRK